MRDFYQSLHVYVCASRSEGTPNPCLEAAACGLPVVTTPVGNMPEFVRDGVNGFFVARDVDAIAATLRRLRDDPELRERMGHAARDGRGVELRADASGDDVDPVFLERTGQPRQREEHERQGDEPHHAAGEDVGRQLVHADHVLVDDQRQDLRVGEDQEVLQRRQRERAGQGAPVPERVTEQKPHSGTRRFRIFCSPASMDTWTAAASSCRRISGVVPGAELHVDERRDAVFAGTEPRGRVVTVRRADGVAYALRVQPPVALVDGIDEDRGSGHGRAGSSSSVPASEPRCCVSVAIAPVTAWPGLTSSVSTSRSLPPSVTASRNHVGGCPRSTAER